MEDQEIVRKLIYAGIAAIDGEWSEVLAMIDWIRGPVTVRMRRHLPPLGGGFTCSRCDGCGKIADSDSGEPWSAWLTLPVGSAVAVTMGIVKPIPCPDCGGTGKKTLP